MKLKSSNVEEPRSFAFSIKIHFVAKICPNTSSCTQATSVYRLSHIRLCFFISDKLSLKLLKNVPLSSFIFVFLIKHHNTIFTTNICEKCPSSIWCRDTNPRATDMSLLP